MVGLETRHACYMLAVLCLAYWPSVTANPVADVIRVVEAVAGERAVLPCEPTVDEVVAWSFMTAAGLEDEIVLHGKVINGHVTRFAVDRSTRGQYNLVINETREADDGVYRCIEDDGVGSIWRIRLTVSSPIVCVNATVGDRVVLPCHPTTDSAVDWTFEDRDVSLRGSVINGFRDRFSQDTSKPGHYDLVINDTKLVDAGNYSCLEDGGLGRRRRVILTVSATSETHGLDTPSTTITSLLTTAVQQNVVVLSSSSPVGVIIVAVSFVVVFSAVAAHFIYACWWKPRRQYQDELDKWKAQQASKQTVRRVWTTALQYIRRQKANVVNKEAVPMNVLPSESGSQRPRRVTT